MLFILYSTILCDQCGSCQHQYSEFVIYHWLSFLFVPKFEIWGIRTLDVLIVCYSLNWISNLSWFGGTAQSVESRPVQMGRALVLISLNPNFCISLFIYLFCILLTLREPNSSDFGLIKPSLSSLIHSKPWNKKNNNSLYIIKNVFLMSSFFRWGHNMYWQTTIFQ